MPEGRRKAKVVGSFAGEMSNQNVESLLVVDRGIQHVMGGEASVPADGAGSIPDLQVVPTPRLDR